VPPTVKRPQLAVGIRQRRSKSRPETLVVPRLMLIWLIDVIEPGMPSAMSAGVGGALVIRFA
jgi:hypothetical protein